MVTRKPDDDLSAQERGYAEFLRFMSDEQLVGFYSSSGFSDEPGHIALMADEAISRLEKLAHRDRQLVEAMDAGRVMEAMALLINETVPERVEDEYRNDAK